MILKLFMIIRLVETLVFQEMIIVVKWDEQEFNWIDRSIFDLTRLSDVQRQFMVNEHNHFSFLISCKYQTSAYESGIFLIRNEDDDEED